MNTYMAPNVRCNWSSSQALVVAPIWRFNWRIERERFASISASVSASPSAASLACRGQTTTLPVVP